ncbi:hypothetical protein JCGZ_03770 [Jatropha curcas]|uniref:Aminotransferase-like plant mobile domain-containing protein n=1 Tax=Jatropha curcas TaxID=180498 RepID=A0A067L7D6_JATCU|nr:hypothetical protein JCGZ_03770 [Jatropha curcas]
MATQKCFYKTDLSASRPIKCFVTTVQSKIIFHQKQKVTVFRVDRGRYENRFKIIKTIRYPQNINAIRGFQNEWRHAGESYVTQLFYGEQLRDAAVQSCATLLSLNFDSDSFAHLDTLFTALECGAMLNPAHLDPARAGGSSTDASASRTFRNQVSSFIQSLPNDLWGIHPMNQLAWLKYFKDLKPDHGFLSWLVRRFNPNTMVFRFEDSEVTPTCEEMCAIMGHHPEQDESPALPPGPRYDLIKVRACCFLLLNMYAMKNRQPGIGDFRLLTVIRDMQVYCRTAFMMIMGETMCWVRDIALQVTNFNVHHRGCPILLQVWALDKLSLISPVPALSIPTYGPANFRIRSRGHFDFGDHPVIRWTCLWWRIRLVTTGSMNLNYVIYASLDRSMAYFPDRINRQYGVIQRVPRVHNFESGPMTQSLLTNLADRWRNRNT